jgi:hypothetical protein
MLTSQEEVAEYVKNNIDSCLASINVELDSVTRKNMNGTLQIISRIAVTIDVDYWDFVDYTAKKRLEKEAQ